MSYKNYSLIMVSVILFFGKDANSCSPKKQIECLDKHTYQFCFISFSGVYKISSVKYCPVGTRCDEEIGKLPCVEDYPNTEHAVAPDKLPNIEGCKRNETIQQTLTPKYDEYFLLMKKNESDVQISSSSHFTTASSKMTFGTERNTQSDAISITEGPVDVLLVTLGRPPQKEYTKKRKKINKGKMKKKSTKKQGTTVTPTIRKTTLKKNLTTAKIPSRTKFTNNRKKNKKKHKIRTSTTTTAISPGTIVTLTIPTETLKKDQPTVKIPSGTTFPNSRKKNKKKHKNKSTSTTSVLLERTTLPPISITSSRLQSDFQNGEILSTTYISKVGNFDSTQNTTKAEKSTERSSGVYYGSQIGSTTQVPQISYPTAVTNLNFVQIYLNYKVLNNMNISDGQNVDQLLNPLKSLSEETTPAVRESTVSPREEVTSIIESGINKPIKCSGLQKYPSDKCNEYYECIKALWWYRPVTKTCQAGEKFDIKTLQCAQDNSCIVE